MNRELEGIAYFPLTANGGEVGINRFDRIIEEAMGSRKSDFITSGICDYHGNRALYFRGLIHFDRQPGDPDDTVLAALIVALHDAGYIDVPKHLQHYVSQEEPKHDTNTSYEEEEPDDKDNEDNEIPEESRGMSFAEDDRFN